MCDVAQTNIDPRKRCEYPLCSHCVQKADPLQNTTTSALPALPHGNMLYFQPPMMVLANVMTTTRAGAGAGAFPAGVRLPSAQKSSFDALHALQHHFHLIHSFTQTSTGTPSPTPVPRDPWAANCHHDHSTHCLPLGVMGEP